MGVPDLVDGVPHIWERGDTLLATGDGSGVDVFDGSSSRVGDTCNFLRENKLFDVDIRVQLDSIYMVTC